MLKIDVDGTDVEDEGYEPSEHPPPVSSEDPQDLVISGHDSQPEAPELGSVDEGPSGRVASVGPEESLPEPLVSSWEVPEAEFLVRRIHTDKGAEFTGAHFRSAITDRGIRRTTTCGSDFKANGRVEASIRRAKGLTRSYLADSKAEDADWSFAMRHAVFVLLCGLCAQVNKRSQG